MKIVKRFMNLPKSLQTIITCVAVTLTTWFSATYLPGWVGYFLAAVAGVVVIRASILGWHEYGEAVRSMSNFKSTCLFFSTLGPVGFFNKGKGAGTIASLATLVLLYLVPTTVNSIIVSLIIAVGTTYVILPEFQKAAPDGGSERYDGRTKYDFPEIVWDEFVGMLIAVIPIMVNDLSIHYLWVAFALFRIFDILKPGITEIEKYFCNDESSLLTQSIWVHLDDVFAGIMSALVLSLIIV